MTQKYTEKQIVENYETFIGLIKKTFSGDRLKKLLTMYEDDSIAERTMMAPASAKEHFHLAYAGGYLDHITNVYNASKGVKKLYTFMGGHIDFTDEEMYFSAIHHDLGKIGDLTQDYYLVQDSEWHTKNRGEIFKFNGNLQYMDVTDRALFLLQHFGIEVTWKEYLAIKLSDGIYNESNKKYYISYDPENTLKTNLPYIVHLSDFISCRTEFDKWKHKNDDVDIEI
jgi:hypothetical protein